VGTSRVVDVSSTQEFSRGSRGHGCGRLLGGASTGRECFQDNLPGEGSYFRSTCPTAGHRHLENAPLRLVSSPSDLSLAEKSEDVTTR
jgi:hypothetical protein